MASYNDLSDWIKDSTAMDDTELTSLIDPAINFGIWLATCIYEPPSQKTNEDVTAVSTADNITLSLTRPLRVDHLYNSTKSEPMWPMSYDQLRAAYIPDSDALYYAFHGNQLFYRATPASNQTVKVFFLQYPSRVAAGENLPFDEYQDFVLSSALEFIWASQEEAESSNMWGKLTANMNVAASSLVLTRQIMDREAMDVNNLSRIVPKGTPPA